MNNNYQYQDKSKLFFMNKRLGFSSLPSVALFIRVIIQIRKYINLNFYVEIITFIILFIIIYIIKLLLSLIMIGKSVKKLKKYKKTNKQYLCAEKLSNITRYAMLKKIPI